MTPGATIPLPHAIAPPRAAAAAGVVFSVLMSFSLIVVRMGNPAHQSVDSNWLSDPVARNAVRIAVQVAPFAGISFLWFIGAFRNRLGKLEDRFFATVFLGSGLLFVASLFASIALSAVLVDMALKQEHIANSDAAFVIRKMAGSFLNMFAIKMAGVFIMSTSTIVLRTAILPRWLAYSGFLCAMVLLLVITSWPWIALLFPAWILVLSVQILWAEFRQPHPSL